MQYVLGIDSTTRRFKTHIFYSDQFLHVQRQRFVRINYINIILSLYDINACMLFLHLNQIICKRKYRFNLNLMNLQHVYITNMLMRFSCVSSVIYRKGCLNQIRNICRLNFYILTVNHTAISPSKATGIFTILIVFLLKRGQNRY